MSEYDINFIIKILGKAFIACNKNNKVTENNQRIITTFKSYLLNKNLGLKENVCPYCLGKGYKNDNKDY